MYEVENGKAGVSGTPQERLASVESKPAKNTDPKWAAKTKMEIDCDITANKKVLKKPTYLIN